MDGGEVWEGRVEALAGRGEGAWMWIIERNYKRIIHH